MRLLILLWMILFNEVDHFTCDTTGSRCTRCHCYTFLALQPLSLELGKILNTHCWNPYFLFRYLNKAVGIIATGVPNNNRQISTSRLSYQGFLTELSC